jgi:hypothetical protein
MDRRRLLAAASSAQLVAGVAGLLVAVRRRRAYDFIGVRGRPDAVARDALLMGTALSAPAPMLAAQAGAVAVLARRPSRPAELVLGGIGAAMVAGYLGERLVRRRLRPSGWDGLESPIAVAGLGLAATMASAGLAGRQLTTSCWIAHSAAAARVETPIFE